MTREQKKKLWDFILQALAPLLGAICLAVLAYYTNNLSAAQNLAADAIQQNKIQDLLIKDIHDDLATYHTEGLRVIEIQNEKLDRLLQQVGEIHGSLQLRK